VKFIRNCKNQRREQLVSYWFVVFPKYLRQSGQRFQSQTIVHLKFQAEAGDLTKSFLRIHGLSFPFFTSNRIKARQNLCARNEGAQSNAEFSALQ